MSVLKKERDSVRMKEEYQGRGEIYKEKGGRV